ncbi:hypothetical protein [Stigmatella aurantiaca]|uniref:Conserved uncharacterized protein n=1 Tax=Stigmatella aurantiaca (strain DW4/3-1) TaxID=378806 RepID=Q097Y0_STIAD|nr:hypothetical protein [Stigmatella aurantiaca]ADO71506.1 conserved uncharacterized protein [Stigmatella aurantiaca DW4/3-1]EAU68058.1 hypothetical protein STIAU_5124 [Stigmatella aurantiaca DW4/3-1]
MNPIERGRNLVSQVRTGAERTIDRAQEAVGNVVDQAKGIAAEGGRRVNQFVDGFENTAVQGARAVQGFFGGGNQPDRVHDGQFVGAGGQTFSPNTPLSDVPAVTPRNNANPSQTILYVNGINTTKDAQANSLQSIADTTGARVIGIHNATEGMGADLAQCVKDKLDKGTNPAVDTLADTLYNEIKAGRDVHLMAHSQGGLISSRALGDVYNRLRVEDGMSQADAQKAMSHINVETFGAAATRYPDGPNYVHYVNRGDPVPGLFGLGPVPDAWNPVADGGKNSVVRHFNEFHLNPIGAHNFESVYLNQRVPFDQARSGNFDR